MSGSQGGAQTSERGRVEDNDKAKVLGSIHGGSALLRRMSPVRLKHVASQERSRLS